MLLNQEQLITSSIASSFVPTSGINALGLEPTSGLSSIGNGGNIDLPLNTIATTTLITDSIYIDPSLLLLSDNVMAGAQNLGTLGATATRTGSVGSTDLVDFYRFQVGSGGNFNLTLTGMSSDADVSLIRDFNANGIVDAGEIIASSSRGGNVDESIHLESLTGGILAPETYFVRVQRFSGDTNYTLQISNNDPNNLISTETAIGSLGALAIRNGSIGGNNTSDMHRFTLDGVRDVTLAMTGLTGDADLRIINDANNNGIVDSGEVVASSGRSGNLNETINTVLGPGNYFAQVYQYSGNTNYNLRLTAYLPTVNVTVNQVTAIDNPDTGWFGDDADYYSKISIEGSTHTTGVISNDNTITPNWKSQKTVSDRYVSVGIQLWDSDGGLAGSDDHIDIDSNSGLRDVNVTYDLLDNDITGDVSGWGGNLLTVNGAGDGDRAQLKFTINEGDWYDNNLGDFHLTNLARSFAADGSLSRTDLIELLREAKDYGTVDATELTDLRRIQSDLAYMTPEFVTNLAGKLLNGDPANTRSGIGNLFAGSSATQMEQLVGKWFLGNDRPDAAGTYTYAGGSLFRNGISYTDVDQGSLGDCYFLAALGATAHQSATTIQNMFIDNGDGTFTVRFYKPDGSRDYVTVDRYLPTNAWGNFIYANRDQGLAVSSANNELWVALAEKAYVQVNESGWLGRSDSSNDYDAIGWGNGTTVLNQITGRPVQYRDVQGNSAIEFTTLVSSLSAGQMVTLGTYDSGLPNPSVVGDHEYALVGYNSTTGMFQLYNPHGSLLEIDWAGLRANFDYWGRTL